MARSRKVNRNKKQKSKRCSRSDRAGLKFSVGRIHRFLRKGKYAERISAGAPVFLTAVIEYLCSEVLELSGNIDSIRKKITPEDIKFAIELDNDLCTTFLSKAIIPNSSIIPMVHPALLTFKNIKPGQILW